MSRQIDRMFGLAASCLVLIISLGACSSTVDVSDAQKRARIDEMFEDYRADFPDTPNVTVDEYMRMRDGDDVVLVDAREPEEQQVSMIPSAISMEQFERNREEYSDSKVVAYCTIGYRSGEYAETLREEGFDAYNLKGSILSWAHAGQPLVNSEDEPTTRVHVYGPKWNLAPDEYEAVW